MITQVTVFLENEKGRLADLCRTVADAGVNMSALSIADTAEYGLVRIVCSDANTAVEALDKAGFRAIKTPVEAIAINDVAGGLAKLVEIFDNAGVNVPYAYCFAGKDAQAIGVFKLSETDSVAVAAALAEAGFTILKADEI